MTLIRVNGLTQPKISPAPRLHWSCLVLLATFNALTFPLLPFALPHLASTSSSLLLPAMVLLTLLLTFSTAYYQSAVIALASLWGSKPMLAVMSGQGGIAVLVTIAQLLLAILSAMRVTSDLPDVVPGVPIGELPKPSLLAGVGLWGLGSLGAALCFLAFRMLQAHQEYPRVISASIVQDKEKVGWVTTRRVLRKNALLYWAVALDFAITLVSHQSARSCG